MPRRKATPAAEEVKTEAVETAETATPVKKSAAKRTTAAKKTTETAVKKTAAKKTAVKAEPEAEVVAEVAAAPAPAAKAEVIIEFGGAQVSVKDIINNAKNMVGADKDIKIYVQPQNSKAYIAFGDESVAMDVYFCN